MLQKLMFEAKTVIVSVYWLGAGLQPHVEGATLGDGTCMESADSLPRQVVVADLIL